MMLGSLVVKKVLFGYTCVMFSANAHIILDLMALGDEGPGRQSRIRDDETNVSSRVLYVSKLVTLT